MVILVLEPALLRLLRLLLGREGLDAVRVGGDGVGGTTGVAVESIKREVLHVVADSVVVGVVGVARSTAKELGLLLGLDLLGSSEDAASRDTVEDESLVVGAAVKFGGEVGDALIVEVLLEKSLNLSGAGRARLVESGSVAVVDQVGIVGGSDHVEVEVQSDLLLLLGGEAVDVVGTTKETKLLSGPEAEADGILETEVGEGLGDGQDSNGSTAIVVDTRA